ncbi:hypothetical protein N5K27_22440 [Pigmentiphaga sp. GD03639]|uniref:hypothetical protein n=1 Tax=Pigmentiphaga sp. GD03639 TaxID=2975354 RepID=UPI00244BA4C8|nr:hypothetical protein [Pigmentiphaga sp. GD03639]MDH2239071.1 hypothetical protein [Pigmentiphaga sp. GD03639]
MPLKPIPIVGPAYRTRSLNQSAQRLVNWRLVLTEKGGKSRGALYPTAGMRRLSTVGDGPIRGFKTTGGRLYVVSGAELYELDTAFNAKLLGTLATSTGRVGMAASESQLLIVDGTGGYLVEISTGTFSVIDDEDFPRGVQQAVYMNGLFIVGVDGTTGRIYWSALLDGSSWNGLDFATAEGDPDILVAMIVDHGELWLYGTVTAEIWMFTGDSDQPVERQGNAALEQGCAATWAVTKADNSTFWIGRNNEGEGMAFRANGYQPVRISDHGVEYAWAQYERLDDAQAYAYQQEGHSFVVFIFPSADATWVYDVAANEWFEWLSFDAKTGEFHRHRSACYAHFARTEIVGDYENGRLYALDLGAMTNDGKTIKRVRATFCTNDSPVRAFYGLFQVDVEAGVGLNLGQGADPQMMMRFSNDGGHTWSNVRTRSLGKMGEYRRRARWERNGSAWNRVWEISITDPVPAVVLGAWVDQS